MKMKMKVSTFIYPFIHPCCHRLFFQLLSCKIICDYLPLCIPWLSLTDYCTVQPQCKLSYCIKQPQGHGRLNIQHPSEWKTLPFVEMCFLCSTWRANDAFCCLVVPSHVPLVIQIFFFSVFSPFICSSSNYL